jgi:hypothetical protein
MATVFATRHAQAAPQAVAVHVAIIAALAAIAAAAAP